MRLFKKLLRVGVTLFLLGLLAIILILRWPMQDPPLSPAAFAPRSSFDKLPRLRLQVFETGFSEAPEAYAIRGGSFFAARRMTHGAVLIDHPRGRVVLDSGLGTGFAAENARAPWIQGSFAQWFFTPTLPLAKNPEFPPLDPKRDFFLLSHLHWDHVGGTLDFPKIPVKVLEAERAFALDVARSEAHGVYPHHISALGDRLQGLSLQDKPYENFPQSLDLFGDRSIVLVSLDGHTPGSLGVFVNLRGGDRFLFVGDALWFVDAEGRPEARSRVAEWTSDLDKARARLVRQRLAELIAHSNEVTLVPIHDSKALEKIRKTMEKSL